MSQKASIYNFNHKDIKPKQKTKLMRLKSCTNTIITDIGVIKKLTNISKDLT